MLKRFLSLSLLIPGICQAEAWGSLVFGQDRWGSGYVSAMDGGDFSLEFVEEFNGALVIQITISIDGNPPQPYVAGDVISLNADGREHELLTTLTNESGDVSTSRILITTQYVSDGNSDVEYGNSALKIIPILIKKRESSDSK